MAQKATRPARPPAARRAAVPPPPPPVDWRTRATPPGGTFSFTIPAWPPSKSNRYQIVRPNGSASHAQLAKTAAVVGFEQLMALAIRERLADRRIRIEWEQPTPTPAQARRGTIPRLRVVNPLFGDDVEVDVFVDLYEPQRTVRDTDNVLKVLQDVCTRQGIFRDDRQIGDVYVRRRDHVGEHTSSGGEETHVHLVAVSPPSWWRNPTRRPTTTSALHRAAGRLAPARAVAS